MIHIPVTGTNTHMCDCMQRIMLFFHNLLNLPGNAQKIKKNKNKQKKRHEENRMIVVGCSRMQKSAFAPLRSRESH